MFSTILRNVQNVKYRVIDQRQSTVRRLRELYKNGGVSEVWRGIRDYYKNDIADSTYQDTRVDNQERWDLIESHLTAEHNSLVDLGCADGYFVEKAGELGLDVQGFEHNLNRVTRTADRLASLQNVSVQQKTIAPTNITDVPDTDVILFLAVHHHWVWQYGWTEATAMFRTVCDRANLVFYEPPGNTALQSDEELDPADSEQYYRTILHDLFGETVIVREIEMMAYKGNDRSDPLFVLDTSNYQYDQENQ